MLRPLIAAALCAACLLVGCGPDKSVAYYNLGVEAAQRQDYEEASRLWTLALSYRSNDQETRYNLGLALFKLKRFGEAEVQLREATALDPMDHQAHELLGASLEKQGKFAEAKLSHRAALNIRPTHVPSLMGLASIALAENQNRTAERYATEAVDLDPNNLDANLLLTEAYFRNADYNAAYGQILSAKRLKPTSPGILVLYGKIAYARRMYADALDALGEARDRGIATDELFLYLGLTHLVLGNLDNAERDFRLSIYKNQESATAWRGLAETYIHGKKWPDASDAIEKALALRPKDPDAILDRALIALNTGNLDRALRDLEALTAESGAPKIANYYLGHAYLRMRRDAEARAAFGRFVAAWEGDPALAEEAKAIMERLAP